VEQALAAVEAGEAQGLVVAKLDRLRRSVLDCPGLMERARHRGWDLIALDLGLDTSTPSGELIANVLATFAQFERRLIGQRTKDALAVKRAQGVVLGRSREIGEETVRRVRELNEAGLSMAAIARQLNDENVPTPRNGRWHPPGVKRVLAWSS
jgi:DNA invertase Pin-like site-specific DNA recombinase